MCVNALFVANKERYVNMYMCASSSVKQWSRNPHYSSAWCEPRVFSLPTAHKFRVNLRGTPSRIAGMRCQCADVSPELMRGLDSGFGVQYIYVDNRPCQIVMGDECGT